MPKLAKPVDVKELPSGAIAPEKSEVQPAEPKGAAAPPSSKKPNLEFLEDNKEFKPKIKKRKP